MWVQSRGQEDPLEKEMASHFSILTWKIPWTEEPGQLQSKGHKKSDKTKQLSTHATIFCVDFLKILRYLHIFQPPLKEIQVINILLVKLTLELMATCELKVLKKTYGWLTNT